MADIPQDLIAPERGSLFEHPHSSTPHFLDAYASQENITLGPNTPGYPFPAQLQHDFLRDPVNQSP
uniref:Uncharacterized protein n=1 Tax=Anguilla anguilla TaxID=7936 RepID=A0A0E9UH92_ANGAN